IESQDRRGRNPLWLNWRLKCLVVDAGCPLYPPERTCLASSSMSAKCQKRTLSGLIYTQLKLGPTVPSRFHSAYSWFTSDASGHEAEQRLKRFRCLNNFLESEVGEKGLAPGRSP